MKQEVTRAHKGWALDNVTLHNEVLRNTAEEIKTPPPVRNYNYTGCYIVSTNGHYINLHITIYIFNGFKKRKGN